MRRVTGRVVGVAATATRAWSERRGARLQLTDSEGRIGQGEASPLPGYSPDTLEQCEEVLERAVARAPFQFPTIPGALAQLGIGFDTPAARFAIETALFDLVAQRNDCSVSRALNDHAATEVPLAALCVGANPAEIMAAIRAAWNQGIRTVKLKIGKPKAFTAECALLDQVRHEFGFELGLRLDANAAWNPEEAMDHLHALALYRPEFVEQPVAPDRLHQLVAPPVAIAADESLHSAKTNADMIFRSEACHVAVLKPMVIGGLLQCRRLARLAEESGVDTVVTHLFDGPIALAASAELALSIGETRPAGLAPHAGLSVWPRVKIPQLRPNRIVPFDGAGLGVALVEGGR